jgi:hypothetical protein
MGLGLSSVESPSTIFEVNSRHCPVRLLKMVPGDLVRLQRRDRERDI